MKLVDILPALHSAGEVESGRSRLYLEGLFLSRKEDLR